MARVSKLISSNIHKVPNEVLQKWILKAAASDKGFHNYLLVNYFDDESAEKALFDETRADLDKLIRKNYRGFVQQLQMAAMLEACNKRIAAFEKVCKNKELIAQLYLYVLEIPFALQENGFGTAFTVFDQKVALMVKRLTDLLNGKLHEDYKVEYRAKVNQYLSELHLKSSHIGAVRALINKI